MSNALCQGDGQDGERLAGVFSGLFSRRVSGL